MRQRLTVTCDSAGIPQADVPLASMWDLVEYLSYQRVSVTYNYKATHFTVSFPRQDVASAQEILNHWATSSADMLQTA